MKKWPILSFAIRWSFLCAYNRIIIILLRTYVYVTPLTYKTDVRWNYYKTMSSILVIWLDVRTNRYKIWVLILLKNSYAYNTSKKYQVLFNIPPNIIRSIVCCYVPDTDGKSKIVTLKINHCHFSCALTFLHL